MGKNQKNGKRSYGIVGAGRFGMALAEALSVTGAEIIVIDRDEERVRQARALTENAFILHSLEKASLSETGIQNCDVGVVCIGEDMGMSILTTLSLTTMGIPTVIAKASSAEHGEILEKLGAEVVFPERDMAVRLANRLENARVLDFIQLSEQLNISKCQLPDKAVGRTVREADLRGRFGLNIIAIQNGSTVTDNIDPDYVFRKGDMLVLSGSRENLLRLTSD